MNTENSLKLETKVKNLSRSIISKTIVRQNNEIVIIYQLQYGYIQCYFKRLNAMSIPGQTKTAYSSLQKPSLVGQEPDQGPWTSVHGRRQTVKDDGRKIFVDTEANERGQRESVRMAGWAPTVGGTRTIFITRLLT